MHSCSDKRELVRSVAAQRVLQLQPPKDSSTLLFGLGRQAKRGAGGGGRGEARRGEASLFLIPGFCRACGGSSQSDRERERK